MFLLVQKCIASHSPSELTLTRHNFSLLFQTLFFSSSANVPVPTTEYLTTQHHISPETALKASSTIPLIRNPHKTNSILSFLKQSGFSASQIDLMIYKFPRILNVNTHLVKEKPRVFQDKGFSTPDTIAIISKFPRVLCRTSLYRIGHSITALKSVLVSTDSVCKILKKFPWLLEKDLSKTVIPNVEFLINCSEASSSQLADYVMRYPRLFLLRPETVEEGAKRVCDMGLEWTSKGYLTAVRVVCLQSEEKFELKMRFFQGLGLFENEVFRMFNRYPDVFECTEKNLKDTMEALLHSGKAEPSLFLTSPKLLMLSLEKRIKPRLEVINVLEDRGVLTEKPNLYTMLHVPNKKFLETYVLSNSKALGDDCVIGITEKLAFHSAV